MSWNDRKIFRLRTIHYTVFIFLLMAAAHPSQAQNKMQAQNKRLLTYYARDSKPGHVAYNASNIPYDELTHIVHVSLDLDPKGDGTLYVRPGLLGTC